MKRILPVLIVLLMPLLLVAEEYTLDGLIKTGLDKTIALKKELNAIESQRSQLQSSYLNWLPEARVIAGRNDMLGTVDNTTHTAGLSVSRTLSLNESDWFTMKDAMIGMQIAELSIEDMKKQVAYEIFSRFTTILQSQKNLSILTENVTLQERYHEQTMILRDNGRKSDIDVLQSEITLLDARVQVSEAELALRQARENLFRYLDSRDEGFPFVEPSWTLAEPPTSYSDPLSVRILDKQLEQSRLSLTQSELALYPDISLGYTFSYLHGSWNLSGLADIDEYDDQHTLSLNVSYPLFNFFEQGERVRRSEIAIRNLELNRRDEDQSQKLKFRQLREDWQTMKSVYDLTAKRVLLARDQMNKAETRYQLGTLANLDFDKARLDYLDAQQTLNTKFYNLLKKREEINLLISGSIYGQ